MDTRKQIVLLIVDDSFQRELFSIALELEGYEVIKAVDPTDALALLSDSSEIRQFSCLILDTGKSDSINSILSLLRVPVIECTSVRSTPSSENDFMKISKPINLRKLIEAVENVTQKDIFYLPKISDSFTGPTA